MANTKELVKFILSAPGKVILHGEHSVVYGKLAIAASLSLRTSLDFQETDIEDEIQLLLPDINITSTLSIAKLKRQLEAHTLNLKDMLNINTFNLEHPQLIDQNAFVQWLKDIFVEGQNWNTGQAKALTAFHFLLIGMFSGVNIAVKPFRLSIKSQLPIGSGLGSSASYSVCLAAGLYQYLKNRVVQGGMLGQDISRDGYRSFQITSCDLLSLDAHERELVGQWARLSDGIMHGMASGVDTATIVAGGMVEFRRPPGGQPLLTSIPDVSRLKILLVDTAVNRNTKQLVDKVRAFKERLPLVVNPLLEALDGVAVAARALLTKHDCMEYLGELVELNHHLLRALGVSHPKLEEICSIAKKHGLNGKLTGAGGGGYAFILVPSSASLDTLGDLLSEFSERGYKAIMTNVGGPGVVIGPVFGVGKRKHSRPQGAEGEAN